MTELGNLRERQKDLILNTCNKAGCGSCGLEYEQDGVKTCSSMQLESQIWEIEMKEWQQ